jgi:hypothetical protein
MAEPNANVTRFFSRLGKKSGLGAVLVPPPFAAENGKLLSA